MICDDCKNCNNFHVSEVGCFGSDKPCEYCHPSEYDEYMESQMQFQFTRAELESWLYEIAFNNCGNPLGDACEEIISRLDGFERFVIDKRKEGNNG